MFFVSYKIEMAEYLSDDYLISFVFRIVENKSDEKIDNCQ